MGRRPIESEMNSIGMTCSPGTKQREKSRRWHARRRFTQSDPAPNGVVGSWAAVPFPELEHRRAILRELNIARIQRLECLLSRAEGVKGSAESRDPPDHIDRKDCLCTDTVDTLGHRSNIETA